MKIEGDKLRWQKHWQALFRDKQVYIRSTERVRYIYFSQRAQIVLSALLLAFSLWVAFASVNLIFRGDIATARERELRQVQLAYEERLNRLQLAYDSLQNELTLARDWFDQATDEMEIRHRALDRVIEQQARVSQKLRGMQDKFAVISQRSLYRKNTTELVARTEANTAIALESRTDDSIDDAMKLTLAEDTPSLADSAEETDIIPHISPKVFARLQELRQDQQEKMNALEEKTDQQIATYRKLIDASDVVSSDDFIARLNPTTENGFGGPFVPLDVTNDSSNLDKQMYRIAENFEELSALTQSLTNLPLATPIHNHVITSAFGPRIDPFLKRPAFHSGFDFGAPTGTPIHTPLSGRIVSAGNRGPYGKSVEIDHGNGIKTRYGHLNAIFVRRGDIVEFQQVIGEVGNTGRSTGPHLHYEIWVDGKVRNPGGFLASGRHLFDAVRGQ